MAHRRRLVGICVVSAVIAATAMALHLTRGGGPHAWGEGAGRWVEVYRGIALASVEVDGPAGHGSGGRCYVARVDLRAPGVGIEAGGHGAGVGERRSQADYPWAVVAREGWAVAINGPHFSAEDAVTLGPTRMTMLGTTTYSKFLVTADSPGIRPRDRPYWVLFQQPDGKVRVERSDAPYWEGAPEVRFSVGSEEAIVRDGAPKQYWLDKPGPGPPTRRSAIGCGPDGRYLYIAAFERASYGTVGRTLADLGVYEAVMLDGGGSTCLVLGRDAESNRSGVVLGGHEPVARTIGIRARPLEPNDR